MYLPKQAVIKALLKMDPKNVGDLIFKYRNNKKLSPLQEATLAKARKKAQEKQKTKKEKEFKKDFKGVKDFL